MIGYVKAYWNQIKGFYRTMNQQLFARERNLDGSLKDYIMKQGFFWQVVEVHKWQWRALWIFLRNTLQLVLCYAAMIIIALLLLTTPLLITLSFPFYCISRYRRLKQKAIRI